jgi:hypothetical protein
MSVNRQQMLNHLDITYYIRIAFQLLKSVNHLELSDGLAMQSCLTFAYTI